MSPGATVPSGRLEVSGEASVFLGLEVFGSSPAFIAFIIRTAWYLAYLILEAVSASGWPHAWPRSRKVAAAWKVSAVCLYILLNWFNTISETSQTHIDALFALTAFSALWKVSRANCSTYA